MPHVGGGFGGKAGIHLEPLLACLSRKAGGRPGEVAGDPGRGVQPPALPQRPHLPDQDRGARRRHDHRAEDVDVLGRRRLRGLRGQRHARVELLGSRPLRDPQRLGRRLHDLHQQALRHRLPRVRSRGVLLGARATHGARGPGHRHGLARVPQEEPAEAGLDHAHRRRDHGTHRRPPQVPGGGGQGHRLRPAHPRRGGAPSAHRQEDRQGAGHPAQGAGHAVLHGDSLRHQDELRRLGGRQPRADGDRPGLQHGDRSDRGRTPALPDREGQGRRREGHRQGALRLADRGVEGSDPLGQRHDAGLRRPPQAGVRRRGPGAARPAGGPGPRRGEGLRQTPSGRLGDLRRRSRSATPTRTATASADR